LRSLRLLGVVGAAITAVALSYVVVAGLASAQPIPIRTVIAFGGVESDSVVVDLLGRQGLRAEALFTYVAGLTSTHRTYRSITPAELLQESRAKHIESFEQGGRSNIARLRTFVTKYSAAEVASDLALETQARSLLGIRSQLQAAAAYTMAQGPLVYAVEVVDASPAQLNALRQAGVQLMTGSTARNLKPASLEMEWRDPALAVLTATEIYERMSALAKNAEGSAP
jgi:hypothetical protein